MALSDDEVKAFEENDVVAVLYSYDGINSVLVQGVVTKDSWGVLRLGFLSLDGYYDHVWLVSHDKGTPPWRSASVIHQPDIGYLVRNRSEDPNEPEWIDQDGDYWSNAELGSPEIIR